MSGYVCFFPRRLLTLWFKYGDKKKVEEALVEGFNTVSIDTWLQVIPQVTSATFSFSTPTPLMCLVFPPLPCPQLIARIHSPMPSVARLIHDLLTNVGKEHPQALVYPLSVASKSQASTRASAANRSLFALPPFASLMLAEPLRCYVTAFWIR